jgi:hypothetical protein
MFGITLDRFGGARLAAWSLSFATGGIACLAGAAAMAGLPRGGKPIASSRRIETGKPMATLP